jgi:hypothetical protein|tara:strand:- start:1011 stop:1283 length:273 start_codon:yes stop_codon:yes gene_type:complete
MIRIFKKPLKKEISDLSGQILNDVLANKKVISKMESLGIRDGEKIISEFLEHKEIGLAYKHLEYIVTETQIELKPEQITRLKIIAERLNK